MLNGARAVKRGLLELVDAGRCGVREKNVTLRQCYRYDTFRYGSIMYVVISQLRVLLII